ncbi:MAG: hypothetical protein QOE70_2650 [Chthoniobacter sp.]|jgi:DNA-binding beta-propeller fold protein YncE|nr:hypothetical protein [Chthoniobacter sp.]
MRSIHSLIAAGLLVSAAASAAPVQSSPIALSADGTRLFCVNPDANSLSVFDVTGSSPVKLNEIRVGRDPQSVAIHPDGKRAFVANAFDGTVTPVDLVRGRHLVPIKVGAEPMALALTPNGTRLLVLTSASNSVRVFDTTKSKPLVPVESIDLSPVGTAPRALAITDDGDADDQDERVFIAIFFSQVRGGKTATQEGEDDQREGRIVSFTVGPGPVDVFGLGPIANAGFNSNGRLAPGGPPAGNPAAPTPNIASLNPQAFTIPTGAFPNQLAAVALRPGTNRGYVVSTAASPNGPLRFNQMAQGLVSVFDATATPPVEITAGQTGANVRQTAPLNLNQGINLGNTPAPRLFLTNPTAMAWRPDGSDAWVAIQNSNLIVRLTVDANGIPTVNNPLVAGSSTLVRVDLENPPAGHLAGKAPRGLAINAAGTRAFIANFISRSITAIDISNPTSPTIIGTAQSSALPTAGSEEATAQLGAELFFTGRGPEGRMSSESWGGCIVCHPQGRADGITWMFDAGPRQTIPLDGTFFTRSHVIRDQRVLNWSAVRDENQDFELNTRGVFGGRGLIDDDRLFYALGGMSVTTSTDSTLIEQFQQFTGAVSGTNDFANGTALPPIIGARRDFAVAQLSDDRVFIMGGRTGGGVGGLIGSPDTVLEFNPRTNQLVRRSNVNFTARHSLGAAAVKTSKGLRIYAVGGYTATASTTAPTNLVEEYNPDTDTWRSVATLPTATAQFGITVSGGINTAEPLQIIHVVSGNAGSESAPSVLGGSSIVQRFQPDPDGAGTWTPFAVSGLTPRRNHGAATALRGVQSRVFVIGGQDAGGTVLATVEEYAAQAVAAIGPTTPPGPPFFGPHPPRTSLPAPRALFGIGSSLSTNQIYLIGGVDNTGTDQAIIFEYSVANNTATGNPGTPTGAWVNRGSLSAARRSLTVTSPPPVTNFEPFASAGRDARQDAIETWIARAVRSARAPVPANDSLAKKGRVLFGQKDLVVKGFSCATCHGGPKWTRSSVDYPAPPSPEVGLGLGSERVIGAELRQTATQPNTAGPVAAPQFPGVLINVGTFTPNSAGGRTNEIRANAADPGQAIAPLGANGFNIPSLLSVHETAPYFYSGLAQTLDQVLDGSQDPLTNGGTSHHFVTDAAKRAALVRFLRSIDKTTPIFP